MYELCQCLTMSGVKCLLLNYCGYNTEKTIQNQEESKSNYTNVVS